MEIFKTINPTLYIVLLSLALISGAAFVVFSKGQKGLLSLALKSIASFCFTLLAVGICLLKGMSIAGLLFVIAAPLALKYVSLNIMFIAVVALATAWYVVPFFWSIFISKMGF